MDLTIGGAIDSSTMKDWLSCPRRYFWRHKLNFAIASRDDDEAQTNESAPERSMALVFGSAIHKGLEAAYRWLKRAQEERSRLDIPWSQACIDGSTQIAIDYFMENTTATEREAEELRTVSKLESLMRYYFQKYPLDNRKIIDVERIDKIAITKQGFASEAAINEGRVKRSDLLCWWVVKMDVVVRTSFGLCVVDHKTTTRLGPTYASKQSPDIQFAGYIAALPILYPGEPVYGAQVDAIRVVKGSSKKRKDGSSPDDPLDNFVRVYTTRNEQELLATHETIVHAVRNILMEEVYPQNPTNCFQYGKCWALQLCQRWPNAPRDGDVHLPPGYTIEIWDPMNEIYAGHR